MNTDQIELLPCPFCGGADIQSQADFVHCSDCGGQIDYSCEDEPLRLTAMAAWNRRADGWIPVRGYAPGGALPDDGVKVLVCTDEDEIDVSFFSALAPGRWAVGKGTVIYWQPLPAAPTL